MGLVTYKELADKYNQYKTEDFGSNQAKVIIEQDLYRWVDLNWIEYIIEQLKLGEMFGEYVGTLDISNPEYKHFARVSVDGFLGEEGFSLENALFDGNYKHYDISDRQVNGLILNCIEKAVKRLVNVYESNPYVIDEEFMSYTEHVFYKVRFLVQFFSVKSDDDELINRELLIYKDYAKKVMSDYCVEEGVRTSKTLLSMIEES